jgi:hypothetical protein
VATTSAVDTIDRIWPQVQQFSRSWMFAKSTDARGIELGFVSGGHFWLVGRAGVLGSCPEDVAAPRWPSRRWNASVRHGVACRTE